MQIDDAKLKQILIDEHYLEQEDLDRAEAKAKKEGKSLTDILLNENLITKDLLGQAIAESYQIEYSEIGANPPEKETVLLLPEEIAKSTMSILIGKTDKEITIATANPQDKEALATIKKHFPKKKIIVTFALADDIEANLIYYQKSLETRFSKIIEEEQRIAPEIIDQIISDALSFHASDIHFEPHANEVLIRFRVDGVLQEAGRIAKEYYENILNRIKVQNHLRIDAHHIAQDGSWHFEKENVRADLRTSIIPTVEGEKVVMRLLASYVQKITLKDIGLSDENQKAVIDAATKPFGMILVTGPTGSGKTTTLYALLKILDKPEVNITTIEDPVEYKIAGANQIQVNTQTNLTFAQGLRSIVRQDPDIILVGEIRDNETAEIAVNAALTGHLLLSTFHANDAATAIPRLLDMDIEPFLLASTLEIIISQRLVRKICEQCRYSANVQRKSLIIPENAKKKIFGSKQSLTLYKGKGCTACSQTGYRGRAAIFEIIRMTPEMKDLTLSSPSTQDIWKLATKQGTKALFDDGLEKVRNGITSIEELLRVAEAPKK